MRRKGRVSGKPTSRTRATGKCRTVGCLGCCHCHPVNKPVVKAKGHLKRLALDITMNYRLDDWRVCSEITYNSEADLNASSGIAGFESCAKEEKILDHPMGDYDDEVYEYQSAQSGVEDPEVDDDGAEGSDGMEEIEVGFPDLEAFRREFESFKSAIEAGRKQVSLPVSEDSWSSIEISDDDRSQTSWDDWSIVDGVV